MSSEIYRSSRAFITPDTLPEAYPILRGVRLPADGYILGLITGALEELTHEEYWEQTTGVSSSEAAGYFSALLEKLLDGSDLPSGGDAMPLGILAPYGKNVPPAGWLPCTGLIYNRVDWPDLYAFLPAFYIVDADSFKTPSLYYSLPRQQGYADSMAYQPVYPSLIWQNNFGIFEVHWIIKATN